jgi:RNA polymerase sigma-70 factor (ECF subfamily)
VSILPNKDDADEALQDVYLLIWRNAGKYDEVKASPITWLATLARNRTLDRLRVKRVTSEDLRHEIAPAAVPAILDVLIARQEQERLTVCLGELEDRSQVAIRGAFYTGATHGELAIREAVPLGTMKSRVRRGLRTLRARLQVRPELPGDIG